MLEVVRVFIHMIEVGDVFFLQVCVNALADVDQAIVVIIGNTTISRMAQMARGITMSKSARWRWFES